MRDRIAAIGGPSVSRPAAFLLIALAAGGLLVAATAAPAALQAGQAAPATRPVETEDRGQTHPHGTDHPVDRSRVLGHTFEDTERWVEMFERPERAAHQMPERVVEALELEPGDAVADIGAGSGYFTFRLARAVGPQGSVFAVDIEPGMLEVIERRAEGEDGGDRVVPLLAAPDDPRLPEAAVDLVLVVNTIHHIPARVEYLQRLRRVLRPGGRVAIVDYQAGELPVGPPPEHKLAREVVIAEFQAAAYRLVQEETFLPYQYFLVFAP